MTHCWEDLRDADGNGSTCMLPDGHEGPHGWTLDGDIAITFIEELEPRNTPGAVQ